MIRLIAAAAVLSSLFVTGASAQTVSEDVSKQLWCGTAMLVAFQEVPEGLTEEQIAEALSFVERGQALVDQAVQAHVDAGFSQEQADQAKADIVPVVTAQVMGDGSTAQYTFEECLEILPEAAQ